MRVHFIQHVAFETPGNILSFVARKGWTASYTKIHESPQFPRAEEIDAVVVMGGPMSAYDDEKLSWLTPEKAFIEDAIRTGKKVLGICLGAQLIADVLGAKVYPGPEKEIGWFPVWLTEAGKTSRMFEGLSQEFVPLHWHGDTFDLPKGAVCLASSELTRNQAFSFGLTVLALQFHIEMSPEDASDISSHCAGELTKARWVQTADEISGQTKLFAENVRHLDIILENFFTASERQ